MKMVKIVMNYYQSYAGLDLLFIAIMQIMFFIFQLKRFPVEHFLLEIKRRATRTIQWLGPTEIALLSNGLDLYCPCSYRRPSLLLCCS